MMAIAAFGLKADEVMLKTISQNIANVTTPGYKRQVSVTPAFVQQFDQLGALSVSDALRPSSGIDASAGVLRSSGEASDVAVEGDAYFELAGPAGPVFSRQGNLRVDVSGRLVGAQGLPVMGAGGEISLANLPFSIAANGEVRQGGRVLGVIKLVKFTQAGGLESLGNGLYAQGNARIDEQGRRSTLRSGFIEGSNVNSPQEMVRLTETVRHFEALHRIVQGYDESLEQAIRKLGEF